VKRNEQLKSRLEDTLRKLTSLVEKDMTVREFIQSMAKK
jgi:hypothetical protein